MTIKTAQSLINIRQKYLKAWIFSQIEFQEFKAWQNVKIQIMRVWKRDHPQYWEININKQTIEDVKRNFDENRRGIEIAIDENHEPDHKALWWVRSLESNWWNSLYANIELTPFWAEKLSKWQYKYFSPEIIFYKTDEETGEEIKNLLVGGAFTNRPFFKSMQSLMASEVADQIPDVNNIAYQNILLFNTKNYMEKILSMIASFWENYELTKEEKAELSKLFSELPKDEQTEELKALIDDATKEDEVIVEEKKQEEIVETKEDEKVIEASEKTISISEQQFSEFTKMKENYTKLIKEAKQAKLEKAVNWLKFSESNKIWIVLPKNSKKIVDFAMSLSETQSTDFLDILANLQTLSAWEIWDGWSSLALVSDEEKEAFKRKFNLNDEEAIDAAKEFNKKQ